MIYNLLRYFCAKNCFNRWSSDKAIAKIKRCSFLPYMVYTYEMNYYLTSLRQGPNSQRTRGDSHETCFCNRASMSRYMSRRSYSYIRYSSCSFRYVDTPNRCAPMKVAAYRPTQTANKIAFQSKADYPRTGHTDKLFDPVTLTLTLTRLPWYTNLTELFWRCICISKMNFLG